MTRAIMITAVLFTACSAVDLPEGRYQCATSTECPQGWYCHGDSLCYSRAEALVDSGADASGEGGEDAGGSGGSGGAARPDAGTDARVVDSGPDVFVMPCDAVWIDCDGDDTNGCEYQSNVGSPVPHNRGGWINCPDSGCTRDCNGCRTDGTGSAQSIYEIDGGWMARNGSGSETVVCSDRGI